MSHDYRGHQSSGTPAGWNRETQHEPWAANTGSSHAEVPRNPGWGEAVQNEPWRTTPAPQNVGVPQNIGMPQEIFCVQYPWLTPNAQARQSSGPSTFAPGWVAPPQGHETTPAYPQAGPSY
ncbi:hypothetical protein FRC06_007879, partial [Ceratobasidium sp. 370]